MLYKPEIHLDSFLRLNHVPLLAMSVTWVVNWLKHKFVMAFVRCNFLSHKGRLSNSGKEHMK